MQTAPTFGRRGVGVAPAPVRTAYAAPRTAPAREVAAAPESPAAASTIGFILRLLFSFEGRLQRRDYRMIRTIWYVTFILALIGLQKAMSSTHDISVALMIGLLEVVLAVVIVWTTLALQVKRRHDLDKPWFWLFLGFIPIAGPIWVLVECCFLEGTIGPNRFGPSPKGDPGDVFD